MNNMSNSAAIPPEVTAWCTNYAEFALWLAKGFLLLAFAVAIAETALALWAKWKAAQQGPVVVETAAAAALPAVDPVKLLEALKALLETLKGLPAWIAIFLAGLALLWMAGQKPELCAPPGSTASRPGSNAQNPARPTGQASNVQTPAETNAAQ